jgi:hypothetical protein
MSIVNKAVPAAAISAAVATAQIFPALNSSPAAACVLNILGTNRLEQKVFKVRASGIATTAGAFTVLPTLFAALVTPAASLVPANWTAIGVGTASAIGTTTAGWEIEMEALFDSISGKLSGTFKSCVNNIPVASAALAAQLAGIVGSAEPALVVAVGLTFSAANVGNIGKLADFFLDY